MILETIGDRLGSNNHPTVIVVCPHPDDEVWGMGGTLSLLVKAGFNVEVIYVTNGEVGLVPGVESTIRKKESLASCSVLGIDESRIIFGNFKDTHVENSADTIRFLEDCVADLGYISAAFIPSVH